MKNYISAVLIIVLFVYMIGVTINSLLSNFMSEDSLFYTIPQTLINIALVIITFKALVKING